jgi:hypothetical protein
MLGQEARVSWDSMLLMNIDKSSSLSKDLKSRPQARITWRLGQDLRM